MGNTANDGMRSPEWYRPRIAYLSQFILPERFETFRQVLSMRTRWMTVCMENTFHPQNASAIIRNCDADAVFAVYPFTPQQAISDAIIKASYIPVFCGVGGGTTHGVRTLNLARDVESQGAMGVVLNSPISDLNLLAVSRVVDIPVIITVTKADTDIRARLESGASILNVACSTDTPRIVKKIRDAFPDVPIIASGGKTGESISATIAAGANAITYTPPSPAILFKEMMEKYRE